MRLILHTGLGGAGTSMITAATACAMASTGQRVVVGAVDDIEDVRDHLAATGRFGSTADDPTSAAGLQLMPRALSHPRTDWGRIQEGLLGLVDRASLDPALAEEAPLLPGVGQLRALTRLLHVLDRSTADVCLVDAGPVTSAVDLYTAAQRLIWVMRRLIAVHPDLTSVLRPLARASGVAAGEVIRGVSAALTRLERLDEALRSPQTSLRIVLRPGPSTFPRLDRRLPELGLTGTRVDLVVLNQTGTAASVRTQADVLAQQVGQRLPGVRIVTVPQLTGEVLTTPALERLVKATEGALAALDLPAAQTAPRIETSGEDWLLTVRVRDTDHMRVQRRGDDLLLTIDERRMLFPLTGALKRCRVVSADLSGDMLVVRFRPEEGWW